MREKKNETYGRPQADYTELSELEHITMLPVN